MSGTEKIFGCNPGDLYCPVEVHLGDGRKIKVKDYSIDWPSLHPIEVTVHGYLQRDDNFLLNHTGKDIQIENMAAGEVKISGNRIENE
jgi:hypothetical protein